MVDPLQKMSSEKETNSDSSQEKAREKKEVGVFLVIMILLIIGLVSVYFIGMLSNLGLLLGFLIILGLIYIKSPNLVLQLDEYERAVIFRRGKFLRVAQPGWIILAPFIDRAVVKDMRVKTVDITPQEVVTKDNIKLRIDAVIFMKVEDAKSAVLNVENCQQATANFTKANLRDVVGEMELAEVISNIDEINNKLKEGLEEVSAEWGVNISDVEIQELILPPDVMDAMHKKREAEEEKEAEKRRSEAKEYHINKVRDAAEKLSDPALQYLYLQALEEVGRGRSSKIIFPLELTHLAERLGGRGGGQSKESIEEELKDKYQDVILDQMREKEEEKEEAETEEKEEKE